MKRIIAIVLVLAFLLVGCATESKKKDNKSTTTTKPISSTLKFSDMRNSQNLEEYKSDVYSSLVDSFGNDEYFIDDIEATYVSQEYIDEFNANSKENIYFGYTLSQLDEQFDGKRYVFTADDNGKTVVEEFEKYDDTYDQIIKNVAVGAGVILFNVAVSAVTGGLGVNVIFATAAFEGTKIALTSAGIGAVISGGIKYAQTGDMSQSLKSAALDASEEFKWGAIIGSVAGGVKGSIIAKNNRIQNITQNGLNLKDAYKIQKKSKYKPEMINSFSSMKEYDLYQKEKLVEMTVDGKEVLVPKKINWNYKSAYNGKTITNLERVKEYNLAPLDETGASYEVHHIGQENNGVYALLKSSTHRSNSKTLHPKGKISDVEHGYSFTKLKKIIWEEYANNFYKK